MKKLVKLLNKKERGFTLIELVVVIGILAILAVLAIPAIAGYFKSSKAQTNHSNAKIVYNAVSAWVAANPDETTLPTMAELVTANYLNDTVETVGGVAYGIGGDISAPTATWSSETDLAAEGEDAANAENAAVGTDLVYP